MRKDEHISTRAAFRPISVSVRTRRKWNQRRMWIFKRAGRTGRSRMRRRRRRSRDLLRGNGVEEAEEEGGLGERGEIERVDRKGGN